MEEQQRAWSTSERDGPRRRRAKDTSTKCDGALKKEKQRSAAKTTSVTDGRSAGALFCCSSTFTSLRETLK